MGLLVHFCGRVQQAGVSGFPGKSSSGLLSYRRFVGCHQRPRNRTPLAQRITPVVSHTQMDTSIKSYIDIAFASPASRGEGDMYSVWTLRRGSSRARAGFLSVKSGLKGPEVRSPFPPALPRRDSPADAGKTPGPRAPFGGFRTWPFSLSHIIYCLCPLYISVSHQAPSVLPFFFFRHLYPLPSL